MAIKGLLKRWWRPERPEVRDYPSQHLAADYDAIYGHDELLQAQHNAITLVEAAAAKATINLAGGFADVWESPLTAVMGDLIRDVLRYGDAVFEIAEAPPMLKRVADFHVEGQRVIRYRIDLNVPNGTISKTLPADAVLHAHIGSTRAKPYMGESPFKNALYKAVDMGLLDYASLRNKRLLTLPTPHFEREAGPQDQAASGIQVTERLNRPGTEGFYNQTYRGTPQAVQVSDLKFAPETAAVELRRDIIAEVYGAVGLPRVLWQAEAPPGMAFIEAHAAWVDGWLDPFLHGLASQISAALETHVSFDVAPAKISQVRHQAETVKTLTEAGMKLDEAKQIAGL